MNTLICGYWQCFVCVSEDFTHIAVSNIHYLTVHGIKMILIPEQNNVFYVGHTNKSLLSMYSSTHSYTLQPVNK